jgi:prolipoprotein diacylglyceryltransferase
MGSLVGTVMLALMAFGIFRASRENARASHAMRRRMIAGSVAMVVVGTLLAFWMPQHIPETPGSPGTLVAIALLWVSGACFAFAGLASVVGAVVARPREHETRDDSV